MSLSLSSLSSKPSSIEYVLCASHCAMGFTCILCFNPHNDPKKELTKPPLFTHRTAGAQMPEGGEGHPVRKWLSWHLSYAKHAVPGYALGPDQAINVVLSQAGDSTDYSLKNPFYLSILSGNNPLPKVRLESSSADFREEKCDIWTSSGVCSTYQKKNKLKWGLNTALEVGHWMETLWLFLKLGLTPWDTQHPQPSL